MLAFWRFQTELVGRCIGSRKVKNDRFWNRFPEPTQAVPKKTSYEVWVFWEPVHGAGTEALEPEPLEPNEREADTMKAKGALIAWTPATAGQDVKTRGRVRVGPLINPGESDWAQPFQMTGGAAHVFVRKLTGAKSIMRVFIEFHTLVVRDGIDPQVAHAAFLAIDEYAEMISPDIVGAIPVPDSED